ncbi:SOS response-associated peptidase [Methylovirgula sp. 4M-Z18]|uniref:SOS response-associated peptidase n=1 Tax=Methylovirgula sp. 4M-Z18 TaxID=2293567 RepID=UPI000E2ED965|nr:SOS response-associated peptidase [Methylovirgula sp. 4M-Z18]RFB80379.1 SOS response-associated peptidase [Methylovirgula sp. 4M-Z18]
MCGRFTQEYSWRQVRDAMDLTGPAPNLRARYNISPTTRIDIVRRTSVSRELARARWGLLPAWWKTPLKETKLSTFNARSEEAPGKPMFRSAWKVARCIVPASGFYEWTGPKTARIPHYITARDGGLLAMAGLWSEWTDPDSKESLLTATILTTAASAWMAHIHDRMPVFLQPEEFDAWLSAKAGKELMLPAPDHYLTEHVVSQRVNSSRAPDDDPTLIGAVS